MNSFSFFDRENTFRELTSKEFDVLIVGGGITGAGIPPPTINTSNSFEVNSFKVFSLSKKEKLFINFSNYKANFIEFKFQKVYSDRQMKDTFLFLIIFIKKVLQGMNLFCENSSFVNLWN